MGLPPVLGTGVSFPWSTVRALWNEYAHVESTTYREKLSSSISRGTNALCAAASLRYASNSSRGP